MSDFERNTRRLIALLGKFADDDSAAGGRLGHCRITEDEEREYLLLLEQVTPGVVDRTNGKFA